MGSAIDKFQSNVSAHISQQAVIAHPERVPGIVASGVPRIDGGHGSGIWRDQRRKRKGTVPVCAAASRKSGNHGMTEARQNAFALAAVIQSVFAESLRQRVPRRCSHRRNAKIGREALSITFSALLPLRWRIVCLVDASRERGAHNWIGA